MTTVVTVMDREGFTSNTDNIVVVDPARRRLLWVPRDVWADTAFSRINAVYRLVGPQGLRTTLGRLGIEVDHSVCVPRQAVVMSLRGTTVTVPVRRPIALWYPLTPESRLEDGRKPVDFTPPRERLEGERIHQWLGARTPRADGEFGSDLKRIKRQQVLLRSLLLQRFDFGQFMRATPPMELSSPAALDDLRRVRPWWTFATADDVVDEEIDGMQVLRLRGPEPVPRSRRERLVDTGAHLLIDARRRARVRTGWR